MIEYNLRNLYKIKIISHRRSSLDEKIKTTLMMESIDLDMNELFDNEAVGEDEDIGLHATLPELDEDGDGPMRLAEDEENPSSQQDDEEGVVANLQRLSKGAAKKKVMRPQPKLDVDRLKSKRGLAALPSLFQDVKFKGKGYEADDLKLIMGKMEHWAHRLFPLATFDQFIDRMEKQGAKKPVQTCLKRIRMDMPMFDDDFVAQYDTPVPEPEEEIHSNDDEVIDMDADDAFEEMIRQERATQQHKNQSGPGYDPFHENDSISTSQTLKTPTKDRLVNGNTSTPDKNPPSTSKTSPPPKQNQSMTPDVAARIEANKRKALEKRAARLGVSVESLMPSKLSASQPCNGSPQSNNNSEVDNSQDHHLASQSEGRSQLLSQSQSCSQSQSHKKPNNDNTPSRITVENKSKNGMQLDETLLNTLESNEDNISPMQHDKNISVGLSTKSLDLKDSDELKLLSEIHSENETNQMDAPETMDLQEGDELNLQLDMSVTETLGCAESDNLNLQLDLSVTDEHSSDDASLRQHGQKLPSTADLESDSTSKNLKLQMNISTDEHSSGEETKKN